MKFETELKKIKYSVLKEVAKLAKQNKLDKLELLKLPYKVLDEDKAQHRCCVYKARTAIYERAQVASGFKPNEILTEELQNIQKEDQVVYVMSAACDQCPIDRYVITDACRGCIEHKCKKACPSKAITRIDGKVHIDYTKCKECGLCKKVCPYNSIIEIMRPCKKSCPTGALKINSQNKIAMIEEESCVNCGACMSACPFGAIADKSYITNVVNLLESKKKVYAVVAPAITGQFGVDVKVGQIKDCLKKIGFMDMVEAACGADAVVVSESSEFIERMEDGEKYMTTSCCPGFVGYIEKQFKDISKNISTTVSPMIATARLIKEINKDAYVVFIGPCVAKKSEATRQELKGIVDYVLTFEELLALIGAYNIEPSECNEEEIQDASSFARGFAQSGGVTTAIENYIKSKEISIEFNPIKISGKDEIKKTLMIAKTGRLPNNFIEGMMCEGGCIGGPGNMTALNKARGQLIKFSKEANDKNVIDNKYLEKFKIVKMHK